MTQSAIFRAAKYRRGQAAPMLRHALRQGVTVPNAIPGAPPPAVLAGRDTVAAALTDLHAAIGRAKDAGQKLRPDSVAAVDLLFTYSPGSLKDKADQDAYFGRCVDWVRATWPTAQILTACVHRDETTPHMQLLLAPTDARGYFNAKGLLGGPAEFRKLQDSFWAQCGKPHGLERGVRGSRAPHVPVQQLYGALAAGAEPPRFLEVPEVPEPPGMIDRLGGGYEEKKAAHEAAKKAQARALAHNKSARQELLRQAAAGRQLSPKLKAAMADRYRAAARAEETAKRLAAEARADRQAAERERIEAEREHAAARLDSMQAAADRETVESFVQHVQTQNLLVLADRIGKEAGAHYVARLSLALGIELTPGRSLIDQARKALGITGQGAGLQALQRLDQAAEGVGLDTLTAAALRGSQAAPAAVTPPRHRG